MTNINQDPNVKAAQTQGPSPGASTELSTLSLNTPDYLRETTPVVNHHTADSVQKKWGERSMSTGVSIQCRLGGGAS